MIENSCPILRVADLDRSLHFYVDQLKFKVNWRDEYSAGISRDSGHLMLILNAQGHSGTWVWMGVENVLAFREELREAGVAVRHEPQNYPWALEIKVTDPDDHVLRFGSEALEGVPFDEFTF